MAVDIAPGPVPEPAEAVVLPADEDAAERQPLLDKPATPQEGSKELLGLSFTALSALLFSLMSVLVKLSGASFPFLQIVLVRSIIQFVLGAISCLYLGVAPWGPPTLNRAWLVARGTAGATGLGLYFFTIVNMPLGDGMTIFFTGPAFTAILARVVLGEPLTGPDIFASAACLCGVALVSRPEVLFGSPADTHHSASGDTHTSWAALAAFAGALMSAVAYCLVRKIGGRCSFMVHVTYFGAVSTILSGIGLGLFQDAVPLGEWTRLQWLVMLSVGLSAFVAQCFLNAGLQMANAGPATLMRNLDIVFAFIFGLVFFHEVPQVTSVLGASLILAATATVAGLKWWRRRA
ncbi:hypothetical protein SpCBS45565_g05822 [Spizellomyces sp. 'palustris']|nr:hypothetical protein SpCBS45565_g05822 [Spizellomyces sp. 'palustris']